MASSRIFNGDENGDHESVGESEATFFGELFNEGINQTDPSRRAMDSVGGDEGGVTEADGNKGHPLLEIPEDIWSQILQGLTQNEVVRSRSVCKKWKEIADRTFNYDVTIEDEEEDSLERLSQLRIRKCEIWRLDSPDQFVPKWPRLLRSLEVPGSGTINPAAFQRIVDGATKLEHLEIDLGGLVVEARVPAELRGTLNGLTNLRKLKITDDNYIEEAPAIRAENLSRIFAHQMPFLKTFDFWGRVLQDPSSLIQHELVQFLSRSPSLRQVILSLRANRFRTGSPEALPDGERVISLPALHTLDISCDNQLLPICTLLLNASTRLKNLKFFHAGKNLGLPFQILSGPLLRNAASLVEVELDGVRLSTSAEKQPGQAPTPLDAGVFRDASNLMKLVLSRKEDDWELYPDELPEQPNLINLWMLPSSLEVLKIARFTVWTEEMEGVLRGLHTMKEVRLTGTGKGDGLGVSLNLARLIVLEWRIRKYFLEPVKNFYPLKPNGVAGCVDSDNRSGGYYELHRLFPRRGGYE